MKKTRCLITIAATFSIFTQAQAFVPAPSEEGISSFCVRRIEEPAFSYIGRMRLLHKNPEGWIKAIAKEKFEDERSKQQEKWQSSGVLGKSSEFFNADPTNFTVGFVTASIAIALAPYSITLAAMIGGISASISYENYNLARGNSEPSILPWSLSWSLER